LHSVVSFLCAHGLDVSCQLVVTHVCTGHNDELDNTQLDLQLDVHIPHSWNILNRAVPVVGVQHRVCVVDLDCEQPVFDLVGLDAVGAGFHGGRVHQRS